MQGDLAYDSESHRQGLGRIGVEAVPPEKGIDDQEGLGETRWPVERTIAWLHQDRRLRIRYERRPEIHQAFLTLACIKICASALFAGYCQALQGRRQDERAGDRVACRNAGEAIQSGC